MHLNHLLAIVLFTQAAFLTSQTAIQNPSGLKLLVDPDNTQPELRILLPSQPTTDKSIEVLFPEHITVRKQGETDTERLYVFQPGQQGTPPTWSATANSLQYQRDLGSLHLLARATLQNDGVLFHYELRNDSDTAYSLIYVPTDPRLTGIFHDPRLERTYIHQKSGFDLLASETPIRLTMPLDQWLPARYLASDTWPIPARLAEKRADGITYYNRSQPVDEPMLATLSADRQWVIATFRRAAGNVWSNPELTCQHIDPDSDLPAHHTAILEEKILILHGTLADALNKVRTQKSALQ